MKLSTVAKTAAAAAGIYGAACYIVFNEVMNRDAKLFGKIAGKVDAKSETAAKLPPESEDERRIWMDKQEFEEYSLVNDRGQTLRGYLLKADKPSDVYVFGSHGYRCNGKTEFRLMTKFYHDLGYNVFLVDHQAAGQSEGKFIGFGYYEHKDCLKWLKFLTGEFGEDIQIILHGVSMGSATVMMMSGSDELPENVKFTVADCGYTSAWHEFEHNISFLGKAEYLVLYGSDFFNKLVSGYHFKEADPIECVKHAKVPMLFIHGDADGFVPTRMCGELYDACNAPYKDMVLIKGADHARSYPTDSATYEAKVKEYIDKFIR
ncbi:MAG: alpha/beta hydrolase [Clostridia bacterium]|nr:alpha/beta hydrolase [Clostridia bacterium]